jgi:flagellar basal body-associated protein FliL
MTQKKETPVWLTIIKLVVLATVLIGGVGLALWWAGLSQSTSTTPAVSAPSQSWGIAGDSPVRSKR